MNMRVTDAQERREHELRIRKLELESQERIAKQQQEFFEKIVDLVRRQN